MSENGHDRRKQFESHAEGPRQGVGREFLHFLRYNRKWWLTPIIVVLLLLSALVILGSSAAAPFIYTLF